MHTAQMNNQPPLLYIMFSLVMGILLVVSLGCDTEISDADVESQVQKIEKEEAKLAAMKERQTFESEMESKVEALEQKVAALKEQRENVSGDEEVELNGEIARLETQVEQMREQLDELKAASGDLWAETKIKAEESWDDVSESIDSQMKRWKQNRDEPTDDAANDSALDK
ncbi:sll1863 family stress response protein [Mariniblastus fucicola]|uniref:Chromosome partition protein Smc n=1 Tax=Mariniblastus fucicola TaxID=980251 RepID=A0A5B9PFC5_9BACT|nr:hypothetical protein [Mariniblastus fucicola]QEG24964.1 hypothetical protein MFFC18_48870 [Mariniblastus fucicola]